VLAPIPVIAISTLRTWQRCRCPHSLVSRVISGADQERLGSRDGPVASIPHPATLGLTHRPRRPGEVVPVHGGCHSVRHSQLAQVSRYAAADMLDTAALAERLPTC
jgi:hypothetical protein